MRSLFIAVVLAGLGGFVGMAVFMVQVAWLGRSLPDLPFHARVNPFNVLTLRDRWTPEITARHRIAVRFGLVFIASLLTGLLLAIFGL